MGTGEEVMTDASKQQQIELEVAGMICNSCALHVRKALEQELRA